MSKQETRDMAIVRNISLLSIWFVYYNRFKRLSFKRKTRDICSVFHHPFVPRDRFVTLFSCVLAVKRVTSVQFHTIRFLHRN